MKIKTVLTEVNIGASNIDIEGNIVYTDPPKHIVSPPDVKKPYDFWSQWIVIEDETGKLGCSVVLSDPKYKLEKGTIGRITGKLKEWEGKKSISGKLVGISKGNKTTDVQMEVAEEYFEEKAKEGATKGAIIKEEKAIPVKAKIDNNVWEEKDLRIARECAVKSVTELAVAKIITGKQFFPFANTIVKYIYNGKVNGKEKKSILRNDREPLEIISGENLFSDDVREEIENAVNEKEKEEEKQGSSYNNAIPYKGKRKKVTKAKDFINEEDDGDYIPTEVLD